MNESLHRNGTIMSARFFTPKQASDNIVNALARKLQLFIVGHYVPPPLTPSKHFSNDVF
jgi:hypothetical protein